MNVLDWDSKPKYANCNKKINLEDKAYCFKFQHEETKKLKEVKKLLGKDFGKILKKELLRFVNIQIEMNAMVE